MRAGHFSRSRGTESNDAALRLANAKSTLRAKPRCRENLQRQPAAPPSPMTKRTFPFIFNDLQVMAQEVLR